MAHILVTGANGFIGSHLVRKLLDLKKEKGWQEEILCMVRPTSNLASLKGLDVKLILGDFREPESLVPAVKGATYIYHVGAVLYGTSRKQFLESNAEGTENLLKAAVAHAKDSLKRFLLVSSMAAAGPADGPEPINEEREFGPPVSWYAESKQMVEKLAKKYGQEIPITIVRPSGVYGPRDPAYASAFKIVRMRFHPIPGFRKRYSGIVFAPDLVEGFVAAALNPDSVGETYFLTNPKNNSHGELLNTLGKAVGKKFHITLPIPITFMKLGAILMEVFYHLTRKIANPSRDKARDISQIYWLCSSQKAKDQLGWEPKHTLLEGAKITHQYMVEQEKKNKAMACESKSILFLKYFSVGVFIGALIEILAEFGKVYHFNPWYVSFVAVFGMWGILFGSIAMKTRKLHFIWQFIPGFLFLFGAELLNHYYLHQWSFYPNDIFGLSQLTPLWRAAWLGIATGFILPLYNLIQGKLFQYKSRVGTIKG
jgi:nucleoside-diphosphate-sugar epimerase